MRSIKELLEKLLDFYLIYGNYDSNMFLCGNIIKMYDWSIINEQEKNLLKIFVNDHVANVFLDDDFKDRYNAYEYRTVFRIEWLIHQIEIQN